MSTDSLKWNYKEICEKISERMDNPILQTSSISVSYTTQNYTLQAEIVGHDLNDTILVNTILNHIENLFS